MSIFSSTRDYEEFFSKQIFAALAKFMPPYSGLDAAKGKDRGFIGWEAQMKHPRSYLFDIKT